MTTRIREPKANTVMIEKGAGLARVRRYVPAAKAANYAASGWIVWVASAGGWKRA